MGDYCIIEESGYPVFDYAVCNICQKCVSICPNRAIMVNNTYSLKIPGEARCTPEQLIGLFEARRSIKKFKEKQIPGNDLRRVVSVAKYAPNQNKNISMTVIESQQLISEIDGYSMSFIRRIYGLMFGFKPLTWIIGLFYKDLGIIKRKMDYDLFVGRRIVKENTQALVILTGNKNVAVTKSSAQYLLATMIYMAESMKINSCLMDSLLMTLNHTKALRNLLGIDDDVLGVLSLGYSNEAVVNIPMGYEIETRWLS
jgi:ferredoxin